MNILILGGAGFIGLNLANVLADRLDASVTIADSFFRGQSDAYFEKTVAEKNIKLVRGDFTDAASFARLEDGYDQVYMLASVVGVEYTHSIPDELVRINTSLILNTLEWLKKSRCRKVLFASTSECYAGTVEKFNYVIPTNESVPLCISDIKNPRFTYAATKILGEVGFYQYAMMHGFDVTIVRYHNVYGPRMGFKHVIPQVTQRFVEGGQNFKIYGYSQTRSFNYITDAVSCTIDAMDSEKANGQIINVGDMHSEISIEELVKYIGNLIGYKGNYELISAPDGSVSRRCPDTSLAKSLLDYEAKVSWQDGVKTTVSWYVKYLRDGGIVFE